MKVLRSFSANRVLKVDAKFNVPWFYYFHVLSVLSLCLLLSWSHSPLGLHFQPFLSILSLLDYIY